MERRLLYLIAAFILSLVGISFYGGPVTYIFFWLVVFIPAICIVYITLVIIFIRYHQETNGRNMVSGTPSEFYITLQNPTWFSFSSVRLIFYSSFSTISGVDEDAVYELAPHSSIKKTTRLLCRYRGEYKVGIKAIVVRDFLGLFSVTWPIKEPLSVITAPALVRAEDLGEEMIKVSSAFENPLNKTEAAIPVREYMSGDDMRFINWKASAVTQKLMVRERTGEEDSGVSIIMDPKRYDEAPICYLPSENKLIELTLALSLYYLEHFVPVDVICFHDEAKKLSVRNRPGFEELYNEMVHLPFREDCDIDGLMARIYERRMAAESHLMIFILQDWDPGIAEWIMRINPNRVPVRVFLIGETGAKADAGCRDISFIGVSPDVDLKEVLV